jgi:hypothetical protein
MELSRPLPVLPCRHCGALGVPQVSPGTGPHVAKASCGTCGQFLKWLPQALVQPSGEEDHRMVARVSRCILLDEVGKYGGRGGVSGDRHPARGARRCGRLCAPWNVRESWLRGPRRRGPPRPTGAPCPGAAAGAAAARVGVRLEAAMGAAGVVPRPLHVPTA